MEIIPINASGVIARAAKTLLDGHLVAFPTETVYGLGADATNEEAVSRIFAVKGRPTDHPLIIHIPSINRLDIWARNIPDYALALAGKFWPGPMTLILKRKEVAKDFITGGQDSVGLRVPAQSEALQLLNEFEKLGGFGIAAPSANRFGAVSPTTGQAVQEEIGDYLEVSDLILDGKKSLIGVESTIIDCTSEAPVILRPGAITQEMVKQVINLDLKTHLVKNKTKTSGLLESHYSPKARIRLGEIAKEREGFIAMANIPTPMGAIRLASPKTNDEYAYELYSSLRLADQKGIETIAVILPENLGIGEAICDRLIKAAYKI